MRMLWTETNRTGLTALIACGAALSLSCAGSLKGLPVDKEGRCFPCTSEACDEPLEITTLGAAGYVFVRGSDTIVVDPFFSNPSLLRVGLHLTIESDRETVLEYMPDLPSASAILVGHTHYDHLLDVPIVAREKAPNATIYASETGKNILSAFGLHTEPLDGEKVTEVKVSERVIFRAVPSEHAPHLLGHTLMEGEYDEPQTKPPRSAFDWRGGPTFAFAIDFLASDGTTDFRVLVHDSAARPGVGLPPADLERARIRVAIPCVASFSQVDNYPATLIARFAPDYIVFGHWEDFFTPYSQSYEKVRTVRLTDVAGFMKVVSDLTDAPSTLPLPGSKIRIARDCPISPAAPEQSR
ncbi:MAG: MBL fold metallo-hydrolase [Myxococcota bacterium]